MSEPIDVTPLMEKGNFVILRELFRSPTGVVYKVRARDNGMLYVLKERRQPELGKQKNPLHEINILSKLQHKNIIQYYGYFHYNGAVFMLVEYCSMGTLSEHLKTRKSYFTEVQVQHMFQQLLEAVGYCHSQNIIHRDIKSLNIFVCADGTLKLGDFGVSRQQALPSSMIDTFYGTPLYVSPEVCKNQAYNRKTDVWSLGIVLYELCCLQVPFQAYNIRILFDAISGSTYKPIPSHFSAFVSTSLSRLLKKNFKERPEISNFLEDWIVHFRNSPNLLSSVDSSNNNDSKKNEKKTSGDHELLISGMDEVGRANSEEGISSISPKSNASKSHSTKDVAIVNTDTQSNDNNNKSNVVKLVPLINNYQESAGSNDSITNSNVSNSVKIHMIEVKLKRLQQQLIRFHKFMPRFAEHHDKNRNNCDYKKIKLVHEQIAILKKHLKNHMEMKEIKVIEANAENGKSDAKKSVDVANSSIIHPVQKSSYITGCLNNVQMRESSPSKTTQTPVRPETAAPIVATASFTSDRYYRQRRPFTAIPVTAKLRRPFINSAVDQPFATSNSSYGSALYDVTSPEFSQQKNESENEVSSRICAENSGKDSLRLVPTSKALSTYFHRPTNKIT